MPRTPTPEPLVWRIKHLREEGLSISAIARETGVPRSTVGDLVKGVGETFFEGECVDCGGYWFSSVPNRKFCTSCQQKNQREYQRKYWLRAGRARRRAARQAATA